MRPSNDGQYLSGVSGKYFAQLKTYDEVNSDVIVLSILLSRRLYSVVDLRRRKLPIASQNQNLDQSVFPGTYTHQIRQRRGQYL